MESVEECPDSASIEDLPLCRICGGPGHGLHYGVNTCDACKGFFHRSMGNHSVYKCETDETCSVRYGKGKMCKFCRYQKCLKVGMSKKAIKLGRYSSKTRHDFTLRLQQTKKALTKKRKRSSCLTSQQTETCVHTLIYQQPDETHTMARLDPPDTPGTKADLSQSSFISFTKRNDTTSPLHWYPSPVSEGDYSPWPKIEKGVSYPGSTEPDSSHPQTSMTPPQSDLPPADAIKEDDNTRLSPLTDRTQCIELYPNTDIMLRNLLEADQAYLRYPGDVSKSEKRKQAHRHLENCRLRAETFGQLPILNEDEHDRLYKQTGLDADERLQFLPRVVETTELGIRKMVLFMKSVSGFSLFSTNDQVNLLKHGRLGFSLLSLSLNEDVFCDLGVIRISPELWFCTYDAIRYNQLSNVIEAYEEILKLSKVLQAQNFTDEERVLLLAIGIITPGSLELDNAPLVYEIHKSLRERFINCLAKRHENPQVPFGTVMGIITQIRSTELVFNNWMRDVNIKKYFTENNPLLKEMVHDIVWSDNDKEDSSKVDQTT